MIPILEPSIGNEELENVIEALNSGWISSQGEFITKFEEKFAEYHGMGFGISTSNGTTALHLALKSIGIKKGDEVIVPSLTFAATANAVIYCNAKPILVDSHPDYWCIDPSKIEEKINKNTRAIIPVHLYGHPCDMGWIADIANEHGLIIVEDAAEAHGAEYRGKKIGTFGEISCFSFYGNKIITTGEGGMCLTNDEEIAERMKILRDHGMRPEKRYWHDEIGFNYRMTNLQAAVGVAQLKKMDDFIDKKRRIAEIYNRGLMEFHESGELMLHPEMSWARCVYWVYSIVLKKGSNMDLIRHLNSYGVDTRPFFYPLNLMPPYRDKSSFPVAENLSYGGLSLPSSVEIGDETIKYVVDTLREFFE